ncbi:hypothetical protein CEXT_434251 [Caerostris extrusa]|uniref:PiggyBac transposable element-derived protein domain-containing protein n=1 Tax=Caerostris extrusa TaxID=172846 RepID=A0AAV4Y1Z2_CAEEX|nr:hypothetical protein CEXT_434251 [Caerostris extrusa]
MQGKKDDGAILEELGYRVITNLTNDLHPTSPLLVLFDNVFTSVLLVETLFSKTYTPLVPSEQEDLTVKLERCNQVGLRRKRKLAFHRKSEQLMFKYTCQKKGKYTKGANIVAPKLTRNGQKVLC